MRQRTLGRVAALTAAVASTVTLAAQSGTVTITVDVAQNRHSINPFVYGVAYATDAQLADLNVPLHRYGGNNTTRYNWVQNADNRGADWYFESIGDSSATAGQRGDAFIASARAAGAQPMITVPMIDWVARLGASRAKLASFSSTTYGAQDDCDWAWFPTACNGMRNGVALVGNDPNDANVSNSDSDAGAWTQHIVATFGTAADGGLRYYVLDNEPSLWHSTHRDVHPNGAGMDEIADKMRRFALRIKTVDPGAQIVGPEEWGWSGYLLSGSDQQYGSLHGWSNLPDRASHGGMDYLPWLLQQLKAASQADGVRLLDAFTVHYYPQGGEFGTDTSSAMQARRNRSTRSLWDPSYVDETWINDTVRLIPRLRSWADTYYYPGTPIGITEYNWGAEAHINGATTQADILGIFGREGLDMAARWTTPDAATPTYRAMKLFRNYDGNRSGFGDVSVRAISSSNPDTLSVFAAQRSSTQAVTVMVVNKVTTSAPVSITLASATANGAVDVWQLSGTAAIAHLASLATTGNTFSTTVPGQSITLFIVPTGGANQPPTASFTARPTSGTAPLAVSFDGSASSDADGSIASYAWTFGDGGAGTGSMVAHTYSAAGTFTATLTVTDNGGATASTSATISVAAVPAAPAPPTNLAATVSGKTVTLRWTDASSNETGFYVERAAKTKTPTYTRIATLGANVTTYASTQASGQWMFRVQAYNSVGVSASSNAVTVRVR